MERLQERVDSSERERNRGSPNLDRDEERVQSGVSLTVAPFADAEAASAACSAESAAILLRFRRIHSSIDDPDRFMIKCKRSHARRTR